MVLSYRQALVLMDHALRLGADQALMEAMADGLPGRRGIRNLRTALANADPRSESAGETLTRELLSRLNLPRPEPQVEVNSRGVVPGAATGKALTEDGWTFVRVKWKDLFHEQEFKTRILTALRR